MGLQTRVWLGLGGELLRRLRSGGFLAPSCGCYAASWLREGIKASCERFRRDSGCFYESGVEGVVAETSVIVEMLFGLVIMGALVFETLDRTDCRGTPYV